LKILPAKVTLQPNTAAVFTIQGVCGNPGLVEEQWICRALIGKSNKYDEIFDTRVIV